jgi:hypothetical protein
MNKQSSMTLLAIVASFALAKAESISINNPTFGSDAFVGSLSGWSTAGSTRSDYVRSDSGTGPLLYMGFGGGLSSPAPVAYASQTLTATLEQESLYTFSFDIRRALNNVAPAVFDARLYAGDTLLTALSAEEPTLTSNWQLWTYEFDTTDASNDPYIGELLKIEFFAQAALWPSGSNGVNIDNVSLEVQPVPEPSTILLLAVAALALLAIKRRKRGV